MDSRAFNDFFVSPKNITEAGTVLERGNGRVSVCSRSHYQALLLTVAVQGAAVHYNKAVESRGKALELYSTLQDRTIGTDTATVHDCKAGDWETTSDNFRHLPPYPTNVGSYIDVTKLQTTSDNFRHLSPYPTNTTSDTCHPTPQMSEVTVTSRNFGQLQTPATLPHKYTCHPTPQVSEVTVTSRNFRQLRTTSDTCHPTPQMSEVTVTSRNFRQLRTPVTLPHKCRKLQ
ncbi:hypothetical protein Bbelb_090780 [Branchiostoma belcheri]|nr:hypothetical protein Bbelb_090780 [Branchiostoma belcheri]